MDVLAVAGDFGVDDEHGIENRDRVMAAGFFRAVLKGRSSVSDITRIAMSISSLFHLSYFYCISVYQLHCRAINSRGLLVLAAVLLLVL